MIDLHRFQMALQAIEPVSGETARRWLDAWEAWQREAKAQLHWERRLRAYGEEVNRRFDNVFAALEQGPWPFRAPRHRYRGPVDLTPLPMRLALTRCS